MTVVQPCVHDDRADERNRPQSEHDFDFAEEVQHLGLHARSRRQSCGDLLGVVTMPEHGARLRRTGWREEGVDDRQQEDQRRDGIERIGFDRAIAGSSRSDWPGNDGITAQAAGKLDHRITHRPVDYRRERRC